LSTTILFLGIFRVLARDLNFLEFEHELSDDFLGIAYLLCGDCLCKVWGRILLFWSSSRRIFGARPCLFLALGPSS